jgi:hypothetical protein
VSGALPMCEAHGEDEEKDRATCIWKAGTRNEGIDTEEVEEEIALSRPRALTVENIALKSYVTSTPVSEKFPSWGRFWTSAGLSLREPNCRSCDYAKACTQVLTRPGLVTYFIRFSAKEYCLDIQCSID